jgi:hypothetical protein
MESDQMNRFFKIWLFFIVFIPLPLFAYLDPGSGSMLFSAVVGIVATLFFVVKGVFFKILDIPSLLYGVKKGGKGKHAIVFYSEGPQYWNVFLPVILELDKRGVKTTYLSSKENDPGLNCGFENVEAKCIGDGNKAYFYLNTLSADICVMTTPGLNVLQIKRSKGVGRYVHITHSAGGSSGYSTFGVDYYDIVLTGGDGDKEFIKTIENIRGIPEKTVDVIGCTYLDVMRERLEKHPGGEKPDDKTTVLISPTWGSHGLLNKWGKEILGNLLKCSDFNVIIRPHPQSFVAEKKMIEDLMKEYPQQDMIMWDKEADGLNSMRQADIMISDFSGIVYDFVFLFKKPVITFAFGYDRKGRDSMDYPGTPWNLRSLEKIGKTIEEKEIENICTIVKELSGEGIDDGVLKELQNGMDKYPGKSGVKGADIIEKIIADNNGNKK